MYENLAEDIKKGNLDFDVVIATPASMRLVGQLGQILGPRGLMPNPKVGTVTSDVAEAVKNGKSGQIQFRTDKSGIVHCSVGKAEFSSDKLRSNIKALIEGLNKATSSTGTSILPNEPVMPACLIRSSKFFRTVFSIPENAWTTYHF